MRKVSRSTASDNLPANHSGETIVAEQHYHHFELTDSQDAPSGTQGRRVTIKCTQCTTEIVQITKRTDAEINAEIDASNAEGSAA
jgi:hypothetical protein